MELPIDKRKEFICLEYPGIVQDVDKMLQTVGGESTLTKVYGDPSKRLELRYRPNDILCKPMCGDRHSCNNFLLRVRRRRKKKDVSMDDIQQDIPAQNKQAGTSTTDQMSPSTSEKTGPSTSKETGPSTSEKTGPSTSEETGPSTSEKTDGEAVEYEYKAEMLGMVGTIYKFSSLMDCQYLPMECLKDGSYSSLVDKICINERVDRSWLEKEAPLVITPPIFSRIDNPVDYAFRDQKQAVNKEAVKRAPNLIGLSRQRRPHFTRFASFDDKEYPTKPFPQAIAKLKPKIRDMTKFNKLKELFDERPVWSKNALKFKVNMVHEQLKFALPLVAYYCITGPWRALWVRLGYDPREDPKAKFYQLLDFRVRQRSPADKIDINTKRSTYNYCLPNTVSKSTSQVAIIQHETFGKDWTCAVEEENRIEKCPSIYKFLPDKIPPFRQMFYQYCDIEEPQIQELVRQNDGKESQCNEKDGWCVPDIQDKCRVIMTGHLKKVLDIVAKQKAAGSSASAADSMPAAAAEEESQDEDGEEEMIDDDGNEMETEYLEHLEPVMQSEEEGDDS